VVDEPSAYVALVVVVTLPEASVVVVDAEVVPSVWVVVVEDDEPPPDDEDEVVTEELPSGYWVDDVAELLPLLAVVELDVVTLPSWLWVVEELDELPSA